MKLEEELRDRIRIRPHDLLLAMDLLAVLHDPTQNPRGLRVDHVRHILRSRYEWPQELDAYPAFSWCHDVFRTQADTFAARGVTHSVTAICATVAAFRGLAAASVVQRLLDALRTGEITEKDFR